MVSSMAWVENFLILQTATARLQAVKAISLTTLYPFHLGTHERLLTYKFLFVTVQCLFLERKSSEMSKSPRVVAMWACQRDISKMGSDC